MAGGEVLPWVIFQVDHRLFALSSENMQSIISFDKVTAMPDQPAYVRGIINYRGNVFRVIDFRILLGMDSLESKERNFFKMMDDPKQDHERWLATLEQSVASNSPFTLTTDPHKCAFGKWFDSFSSDNSLLMDAIRTFDGPHRRIHALADKIEALRKENRFEDAKITIAASRDTDFALMKKIFAEVKDTFKRSLKEFALILSDGENSCALTVDSVNAVEHIDTKNIQQLDGFFFMQNKDGLFTGITHREQENKFIILVNDNVLLTSRISEAVSA